MQPEQIKAQVESHLPDSQVQVGIDGSHVSLVVVSPAFEGLSAVKKQQLVYAALSDSIASGSIHAVHMKTFTPQEWQQQQ
jgi:acid stress-induced BolA-like protein IbaG/YrbA